MYLCIKMRLPIYLLLVAIFLYSCTDKKQENGKMKILCTTGIVKDLVQSIVGDHADVSALMGSGVDPHVYKASQGDIQKFYEADLIVANGLHLEGKLAETLESLKKLKPVYILSTGVNPKRWIQTDKKHKVYDPHLWFDVSIWNESAIGFGKFIQRFDSLHEEDYIKNLKTYSDTLALLHQWVRRQIGSIPKEQRVLITSHDAFNYFGKAYQMEVLGLQGISTMSEYGLRDISDIVTLVTRRKIPAVFIESSVSSKSLMAVIESCRRNNHEVKNGGMIYSDAMGKEGTPEGTYRGMIRHNVNRLVDNLSDL